MAETLTGGKTSGVLTRGEISGILTGSKTSAALTGGETSDIRTGSKIFFAALTGGKFSFDLTGGRISDVLTRGKIPPGRAPRAWALPPALSLHRLAPLLLLRRAPLLLPLPSLRTRMRPTQHTARPFPLSHLRPRPIQPYPARLRSRPPLVLLEQLHDGRRTEPSRKELPNRHKWARAPFENQLGPRLHRRPSLSQSARVGLAAPALDLGVEQPVGVLTDVRRHGHRHLARQQLRDPPAGGAVRTHAHAELRAGERSRRRDVARPATGPQPRRPASVRPSPPAGQAARPLAPVAKARAAQGWRRPSAHACAALSPAAAAPRQPCFEYRRAAYRPFGQGRHPAFAAPGDGDQAGGRQVQNVGGGGTWPNAHE
eukprot:scaffold12582_cov126-Isochrysis_galbana.AAC.9